MMLWTPTIEAHKVGDGEYELTLADIDQQSLAKVIDDKNYFLEDRVYGSVYGFISHNMPVFGDRAKHAHDLKQELEKGILEGHKYGYENFGIMLKILNNDIEYAGIRLSDKDVEV